MAERTSISALSDTPIEKRVWYRGTLFNACIIGGVGFTAPGLWNAMNALGAGGAQEPFLINAANALVFGLSMRCLAAITLKISIGLCANLLVSGDFVSVRWPYRQPDWLKMDPDARRCGVSVVFVCITRENVKYCYLGTDFYI